MKIKMELELAADNEIRFFDACKAAAAVLDMLAEKAIHDGDHEQFRNTNHEVIEDNDDRETVGSIRIR